MVNRKNGKPEERKIDKDYGFLTGQKWPLVTSRGCLRADRNEGRKEGRKKAKKGDRKERRKEREVKMWINVEIKRL